MANGQCAAPHGTVIQGTFIGGRVRLAAVAPQASPIQPRMAQPNRGASAHINHQAAHVRDVRGKIAQPRGGHRQPVHLRAGAQGAVVQRHGNGEAFQLPANLSNFGGGGGQPLPGDVRQKMESFFGTSFADVRVHVSLRASSIGALALTQGSNLYFAAGQYNPHTSQGQQILGHELAHVVQQRAGRVRNPFAT